MTSGRPGGPGPGADDGHRSAAAPTRTSIDSTLRLGPDHLLAGRYRVVAMLGIGGMGMVYRARDEELGIEVAVKVLRPELAAETNLIDRFRRELIMARQVTHRHVVRIHDIGQDGDLYFLTMDFVEGRSLRQILEEDGPMDPERVAELGRQLAGALDAAHEKGIIHRDLKPSNILLDAEGRAFISDFGIARSLSAAGLTRTGSVVGTPDYLSPEQARGEDVDGRSDIYSLGLILFEMLTGELPHTGGTFVETVARRAAGKSPNLARLGAEIPPGLRAAIRRCLESAPRRRYASAAELGAALAEPERRGLPFRPRTAFVAVAGAVFLALAGWGLLELRERRGAGGAASGVEAAATREIGLAVLPFEDETGQPKLAWLSGGLAEMLAEALAESPTLRVTDSQQVFQTLSDLKLAPPWGEPAERQLAELFDARRLLHGKVRSTPDGLRLDARLVARDPGGELRSLALSAESAGDPAELVRQIGRSVRENLELPAPSSETPVDASPEALEHYFAGSRLLSQGDALAARPELERAVETEAAFGPAWLRLAEACRSLGLQDRAEEAADRATELLPPGSGRLALEARALEAALSGDAAAARRMLEELTRLYPNDLESAVALAEALGGEGMLQEAIATLEGVVEKAPNHPRAWYLLAKNSILAGESRKAIDEYLVRALVIQNRLRSQQGKADVLNAFGVAYRELGDLDQADENYRQAAELRREIGDRRGYATTLRNLGQVRLFRGELDAAEEALDSALEILQELGDEAGRADLLNDLGVLEEERGRYAPALEHYRQALAIRRSLGDRRAAAESLNNVGYIYFLMGQHDNASVYWDQALQLYRETGNREGEVLATQSLAQLQFTRGDWDTATRSYLEALEISREIEFPQAAAVSLGYLGSLALERGRYSAALSSYDEALAILEELADVRGLAEFTLGKAETLISLGLPKEAGAELDRAAEWIGDSGNLEQRARLERLRAVLSRRAGDLAAARRSQAAAVADAEASGSAAALLAARIEAAAQELAAGRAAGAAKTLDALAAEAGRMDHAVLRLEAGEWLGRARLEAGDAAAGRRALEEAIRLAGRTGGYAGAWRLYRLLAQGQEAAGQEDEAAASRRRAEEELQRIRQGLAPEHGVAFDRLVERDSRA